MKTTKILETEKYIAQEARRIKKMHPELAKEIEQEAIKQFEEHWSASRFLCFAGPACNVFQLTKSYLDEKPLFTSKNHSYWIRKTSVGIFGNKIEYTILPPDSHYVAINAILNYAEEHNIKALYVYTAISSKNVKKITRQADGEPYWYASPFKWEPIIIGESAAFPKDSEVWFGIWYDFTRR